MGSDRDKSPGAGELVLFSWGDAKRRRRRDARIFLERARLSWKRGRGRGRYREQTAERKNI